MAYRNNVSIKTRYSSFDECIKTCLDYQGEAKVFSTFSRGIGGTMTSEGKFLISSKMKGSAMFEFSGMAVEKTDGIYLEGDIYEKPNRMKLMYISIAFMAILGIMISIVAQPLGIIAGVFFLTIPWLNVVYTKKSDALYYEIIKKVR